MAFRAILLTVMPTDTVGAMNRTFNDLDPLMLELLDDAGDQYAFALVDDPLNTVEVLVGLNPSISVTQRVRARGLPAYCRLVEFGGMSFTRDEQLVHMRRFAREAGADFAMDLIPDGDTANPLSQMYSLV